MSAKSVVIGWAIWATSFLSVFGILLIAGFTPWNFISDGVRWWYLPATFLAWWTAVAISSSLALIGRPKTVVQIFLCSVAMVVIKIFFSEWLMSDEAKLQLNRVLAIAVGIGFVAGSAWLLDAARRQRLIGWSTVVACIAAWLGLSFIVLFDWVQHRMVSLPMTILIVGVAALAVVPFAATPLAVSWNRNR